MGLGVAAACPTGPEHGCILILTVMTRRTAFQLAGAAAALPPLSAQPAPLKGRLKQSAARWCYGKMSLDDLAREGRASACRAST